MPRSLRQASYGLGATKWQTIWHHVLPGALPGILTGTILAVSRAIGETAPAGGGRRLHLHRRRSRAAPSPSSPTLPIQIYQWTARPQAEFRNIAAAAIIVLLVLLLTLNADGHPAAQPHLRAREGSCMQLDRAFGADADSRDAASRYRAIEARDLNIYYGAFRAVKDVSLPDPAQQDHRHHRPVGLRQEHRAALLQPHERPDARRAHRGRGAASTARTSTRPTWTRCEVRRRIGMVFQKPNPFPKSIYENVAWGARINGFRGSGPRWTSWSSARCARRRCGTR